MRLIASAPALFAASLLAASLTGCVVAPRQAAPYPAPVQAPVASQPAQRMEYGRVANVERVQSQERPRASGAGAVIGGIAGAVLGHQIGGGTGRGLATVVGAVGGAVAGNAIENSQQPDAVAESLRVTVQADDGSIRYFSVPLQTDVRPGDRVRMANGQLFR